MSVKEKVWDLDIPEKGAGNGDFEVPPEGNHLAVCVAVIDLGTQRRRKYQSEEMEERRELFLVWELVDLEGNPLVGRNFKASLHEKAGLRHFVDSWVEKQTNGQKFNVFSLAGKPCLLNVKHGESKEGRPFARVEGAAPLPLVKKKPIDLPAPAHDPVALAIDEYRQLPAWVPYLFGRPVKNWLAEAVENRRKAPTPAGEDTFDPDELESDNRF